MTVICFLGKPRTGKTLFMTFFGFSDYTKGNSLFANYKLYFPNKRMSVYDMLSIPFDDVERNPKTLLIQEADKIFDSRNPMKAENKLLSSLTGQSGKRNLNIYYDTQFWNRIEGSLRDVTEIMITSSCYYNNDKPIAFEYTITDIYEYQSRHDYNPKKITLPAILLEPYFKLYNSYEETRPLTTSKGMKNIVNDMIGGNEL